MSDKLCQAINEVLIEISDEDRAHLDPDVVEKIANRIASFLVKGVGNLNPVYDLLAQAHADGKYPASTPQGHGDNLRDYTNRMAAMFMGGQLLKSEGGKTMLTINQTPQLESHRGLSEEATSPKIPKASEMAQ